MVRVRRRRDGGHRFEMERWRQRLLCQKRIVNYKYCQSYNAYDFDKKLLKNAANQKNSSFSHQIIYQGYPQSFFLLFSFFLMFAYIPNLNSNSPLPIYFISNPHHYSYLFNLIHPKQYIYYMLSSESQNQAEESQPPGLFQPVLGQANQQELIHFEGQFKALLYNRTVTLCLYQDRVVAKSGSQSYFFLLEEEIAFQSKFGSKEVRFESRENGQVEVFETENLIELEGFCDKLRPLCSQKKFSEKYKLLQVIGGSAHSKVFRAHSITDGNFYAVKKCQYGKAIKKELQMLRVLRHPNLIFFHEYFIEDTHDAYLILDYCDGGTLLDLIRSDGLSPKLKHQLTKDILNGLEYLRLKGIVHRDLKPENILYSKSYGTFTIADFGIATWQNQLQDKIVGTPGYIAPEIFKISKSNPLPANLSSDIYAAGLIIYEAITGRRFFEGDTEQALLKTNQKGNSFKSSEDGLIHKYEVNLLRKMIRREPKNRKNSYEIMKSEYMSKLNKLNGFDLMSVSTESPKKRSSESSEKDDQNLFNAVKNLLKMRSSSY